MERKIYVVVEDWCVDYESEGSPYMGASAYTSYDDALNEFMKILETEEREGCISRWRNKSAYCEEKSDDFFECWIDGTYCQNHYKVEIRELILKGE